jgi:hypothetical protein
MPPLSERAALPARVTSAEGMNNRCEPSEAQHSHVCIACSGASGANTSHDGSAVPVVPTGCEGHSST